jgi:hypothetical protein
MAGRANGGECVLRASSPSCAAGRPLASSPNTAARSISGLLFKYARLS